MTGSPRKERGQHTVPNTLYPPPGNQPVPTRLQIERAKLAEAARRMAGLVPIGRPLSQRSIQMLGQPCPGGWNSDSGYCDHACRCDSCRAAHREKRLARLHRARHHQGETNADK